MTVLSFPEPKDMREQIAILIHCQVKTNEALKEICSALEAMTDYVKHQEAINRLALNKLEF
jgi:hypothetical protein